MLAMRYTWFAAPGTLVEQVKAWFGSAATPSEVTEDAKGLGLEPGIAYDIGVSDRRHNSRWAHRTDYPVAVDGMLPRIR